MSDTTKIEWATQTFNPWIGCTKVSPGCANCYAEKTTRARVLRANGWETWGKGKKRSRTSKNAWREPERWNRAAMGVIGPPSPQPSPPGEGERSRPRVFPSLCDWLDEEVPIEWLADFLKLIHDTPNLDWLLLTKRPENWRTRIGHVIEWMTPESAVKWSGVYCMLAGWMTGRVPANVWIGTSVEDQKRADERLPELLQIRAKVRFLSVEPLLGEIDLGLCHGCRGCNHPGNIIMSWNEHGRCSVCDGTGQEPSGIAWIIVGGESGPGARPCNVEWIRSIVRQCQAAGVPCFVKQLGSTAVSDDDDCHCPMTDIGKENVLWKAHWKHPKGGDPAEWPEDLRVREFPRAGARGATLTGATKGAEG